MPYIPVVVTDPKDPAFPQPQFIDAETELNRAFDGILEHAPLANTSARYIVMMLQEKKAGWIPFLFREIQEYYGRHHGGVFHFGSLVKDDGSGFIVQGKDGYYRVTNIFIERCFEAAPLKQETISA